MSCSSSTTAGLPFSLQITTDGCCRKNGTPCARAGWGAVLVLSNNAGEEVRAEVSSALCDGCDGNHQTNNRAELRAAQFALHFIHELCKLGHPTRSCGFNLAKIGRHRGIMNKRNNITDARSVDGDWVSAVIRSDSTFVIRGLNGQNRQANHQEVWREMNSCKRCLVRSGCDIRFEHVYGHSGDVYNERADTLAKSAASEAPNTTTASCLDCDMKFDDYHELAGHLKGIHMQRDLEGEADLADHAEQTEDGMFICPLCPKKLKNMFGLRCHLADKHGMR